MNKRNRLVSVVIATYNQEQYIATAIESVINQSYDNIEIIISDDASNDNTFGIAINYAKRFTNIKAITVSNNTGIAANVNRGIIASSGYYLTILAGDDFFLPRNIELHVSKLEDNSDASACISDAYVFYGIDTEKRELFSHLANGKSGLKSGGVELWFKSNYRMPNSILYKLHEFPKCGFDERLKYVNDWVINVDYFLNKKLIVINEPLLMYRRHEKNVTQSTELSQIAADEFLIALGIVEARYPSLLWKTQRMRQGIYFSIAKKKFKEANYFHFFLYLRLIFLPLTIVPLFLNAITYIRKQKKRL